MARSAVGSIADMIKFRFLELWFWRRVYLWNLRCWLGVCGCMSFDVKSCCLLDGLSSEGARDSRGLVFWRQKGVCCHCCVGSVRVFFSIILLTLVLTRSCRLDIGLCPSAIVAR